MLETLTTDSKMRPYDYVSKIQEYCCLKLFKEKKLDGMYEYWERIRIEENCDMTHSVDDGCYEFKFKECPSRKKIHDSDASAYCSYCDHCPGWILPIMTKCGCFAVYNLIDRNLPQCEMFVYLDKARARAKQKELIEKYSGDVICSNLKD